MCGPLADILVESDRRQLGIPLVPISRRPPNTIRGTAQRHSVSIGGVCAFPSSAERADRRDLCDRAQLRQELRAALGNLDVMEMERVIALRKSIAANRFNPDPRSVAHRLLREVLSDLLA